jgi:hypothetical protein
VRCLLTLNSMARDFFDQSPQEQFVALVNALRIFRTLSGSDSHNEEWCWMGSQSAKVERLIETENE